MAIVTGILGLLIGAGAALFLAAAGYALAEIEPSALDLAKWSIIPLFGSVFLGFLVLINLESR